MVSPYDYRTEETRKKILGDRKSYIPNKYYKPAEGKFYFYINTKGYYHIIIPNKVNVNGKFAYYQIVDYLLTKDNMLKECSRYGKYNNIEDLAKAIETDLVRWKNAFIGGKYDN